jgi:ribonuclease HII
MGSISAGLDEVGRGCIAGPVVAAAVVLDPNNAIDGLRDSKKLSFAKRLQLADEIRKKALSWSIARADAEEIDHLNILQASLKAMARAHKMLEIHTEIALVDGNQAPLLDCPVETFVGGDDLIDCISAASILAKVYRDREMIIAHALFPHYGFDRHMGYPTPMHIRALDEFGPCALHRKSFSPVLKALRKKTSL